MVLNSEDRTMAAKLITYDLRAPNRNYEDLYEVIKSLGHWCHPLESTWLVVTSLGVDRVAELVQGVLPQNDLLLVLDVTQDPSQGLLPKEPWDWIPRNI